MQYLRPLSALSSTFVLLKGASHYHLLLGCQSMLQPWAPSYQLWTHTTYGMITIQKHPRFCLKGTPMLTFDHIPVPIPLQMGLNVTVKTMSPRLRATIECKSMPLRGR
jgi:hypothetical protein